MNNQKAQTKILIVDDDDEFRSLIALWLNKHDYLVIEARDGEEAISMARSELPGIILMDIALPQRSGISAVYKIRLQSERELPLIVAITAYSYPDLHQDALDAGCLAVLTKPFDFKSLESLLNRLCTDRGL